MKTTVDKKSERKNIVKISVVIPTYNRPDTLKRAITSVLSQTCTDFEIIIVNDSHQERPVWDIINHFADERIRYFRNERSKGGNGARNTGIIKSKGEYIAFLDDDDEWLPDKLYLQQQLGTRLYFRLSRRGGDEKLCKQPDSNQLHFYRELDHSE